LNGLLNRCIKFYIVIVKFFLRLLSISSKVEIVSIDEFANHELEKMNIDKTHHILLREAARLNWRFKDLPSGTLYKRFLFRRNGKLIGYLIVRDVQMDDLSGLAIVDFFFGEVDLALKAFVQHAIVELAEKVNIIFILANDGNPTIKQLFGFPFMKIPKKYEPQSFPIYVPGHDSDLGIKKESFLTLFDLDIL
jgi:hypothetical protein